MANRFTRVPAGPVPPLPRAFGWLVWPADAFMLLMLSRPASGSLRATWVTPATFWLCLFVMALGMPVGLVAVAGGVGDRRWLRVAAGVVIIMEAVGSAAVAAVGALQRQRLPAAG